MSVPVFWAELAGVVAGQRVLLDGAEGHHAADVRRLRVGESVVLTDGSGTSASCVVRAAERGRLDLAVEAVALAPRPDPRIVVVQALPKGDRGETAVETLVEVGVDVIVPWAASRCVTQWRDDRGRKALDRWRSTAREAAKQSRRTWWPHVEDLASTADVVELLRGAALSVVLHESAVRPLADLSGSGGPLALSHPDKSGVVLVVGPEGGISDEELASFAAAGATAYRLGPTVLRTSTAGTVAAAVVLTASGRWG